ncbi:hypothetical protein MANES_15G158100v8 [Manihot esculenta]|nr:hypothetical protein MANES_15G158100v8 [Manihot esculenta]
MALVETLRAPYFSITLPERFELDAFDLEILEDTSEDNVLPHEEITLKDGISKTGEIVPYFLAKYHCDEFTACKDTFSMGYTPNEAIVSSHLIDFNMEVGISSSNLEASIKKLKGSSSSLHESIEIEMVAAVEEEPPNPVKSIGEDHPNSGECTTRVLEVVDSGEMHADSSMPELWHNSVNQEACLNIIGEVEEEPENSSKTFGKHHQMDGQMIKLPDMVQSDNENIEVIKEDNLSDIETSVEKLRDIVSQEECRDMEIFCLAEPSAHGGTFDKEHQSDAELKKLLEVEGPPEKSIPFTEEHMSGEPKILSGILSPGNRTHEVFTEAYPLSISLDTTPQSKFPNAAGVTAPEFFVVPTPAAREGARVPRKRKCIFDDVIVFPNNVIKQYIEDASNLVCKRKKTPHTALAAWRAHQVSSLPQSFLEPLIPCTSSELRSLFCAKKLKVPESVDIEKLSEKLTSECPTVETLEKFDESRSCTNGRMVENTKSLEQLNVSAFPAVGRLIETVEPPEKLDVPKSPTAGRSLEQMSIAPETPVLQRKSLRSFESPEVLHRVGLDSDIAQREPSTSREQELDLSLMNEEINLFEGQNQDQYGWSERTRVVVRCLCRSFLNQKNRKEDEVVNLQQLLEGRSKKESARFFYEILVLKSKGYVQVKQENAYGDILIWKASQWEQICVADCAETAVETMHFLQHA